MMKLMMTSTDLSTVERDECALISGSKPRWHEHDRDPERRLSLEHKRSLIRALDHEVVGVGNGRVEQQVLFSGVAEGDDLA